MLSISNKFSRNPFSGRNSAGQRFQFRVRSISRNILYLPLSMKSLLEIKRLLNGDSPLDVFNCNSIQDARKAFYRLRKKYDFPYWAAIDYTVQDKNNPHRLVPLLLNPYQHHIADIFLKRFFEGRRGIYLISKSIPKCGLTTLVQAYILWLQVHILHSNSVFYVPSVNELRQFKTNLCRSLKKDKVYDGYWISVPDTDALAYFNTYTSPNLLSGLDYGFVHLADMSKWNDPTAENSSLIFSSSLSRLQNNSTALFIMEGDIPYDPQISSTMHWNYKLSEAIRYLKLEPFATNPFFIDKWLMSSASDSFSIIHHINLDSIPLY